MTVVVGCLGALLVGLVLHEAFELMLLPRRVRRRVRAVRLFFWGTWAAWSALGRALPRSAGRDAFLSAYGPFSMVLLFALWLVGLIVGFGFLQWAVQGGAGAGPSLAEHLYLSGITLFTVGSGDTTPVTSLGRALGVVEAGTGLGFIAVVIGYLPVLYQLYARREEQVIQLDARAGSPPSALTLLRHHAENDALDELALLLKTWEIWCCNLVESHLSYPMLSHYRSQRENQSWLAALATILDTSALMLVGFKGCQRFQARMTFAMARLAAVEMARVFEAAPENTGQRLSSGDFVRLERGLAEAGLVWREAASAERRLDELRESYEPYLRVLAERLLFILPEWLPPRRGEHANWQEGDGGRAAERFVERRAGAAASRFRNRVARTALKR